MPKIGQLRKCLLYYIVIPAYGNCNLLKFLLIVFSKFRFLRDKTCTYYHLIFFLNIIVTRGYYLVDQMPSFGYYSKLSFAFEFPQYLLQVYDTSYFFENCYLFI